MQLIKRLWHWCFPVNIAKFLRTSFFTEHLWQLPLVKLESSLWNQQNFSSSYFWLHWYDGIPLHCDKNSLKCDIQTITCGSLHSYSFISFNDMHSTGEVPQHSQNGWCFEIVFWMIWMLRKRLFITFIRTK